MFFLKKLPFCYTTTQQGLIENGDQNEGYGEAGFSLV